MEKDNSLHKSLYYSHWPEIIRLSGKFEKPKLIGNYIKFNFSLLDSIQIFNLQFLYDIFVIHKWQSKHIRIDSLLWEFTKNPLYDNCLEQTIYVPLRELVRHFDGYDHVNIDRKYYIPLQLSIIKLC